MPGSIFNAKSLRFYVESMTTFSCQKLDLVLKKCTSLSGSIFNTKSTCFERSVPVGNVVRYFGLFICVYDFCQVKGQNRVLCPNQLHGHIGKGLHHCHLWKSNPHRGDCG